MPDLLPSDQYATKSIAMIPIVWNLWALLKEGDGGGGGESLVSSIYILYQLFIFTESHVHAPTTHSSIHAYKQIIS